MAKKAATAAKAVPYRLLRDLLGKRVDDPAVTAALAKAGKVTVNKDFVVAKEAGFDFALSKKLLSTPRSPSTTAGTR